MPWNPAQGITKVLVSVPDVAAGTSRVTVRIYDLRGRAVLDAVDEILEPGHYLYAWKGRDARGARMAPGVYIAVMEAPGYRGTSKLILTR